MAELSGIHVASAAGGGTAFGAALASVIAHRYSIDASLAAQWVTVIAGAGAGVWSLAWWFIGWRWPTVPPPPSFFAEAAPEPPQTHTAIPVAERTST